tara:strand:+ start:2928 stop:3359 length:432 start_codon:yes stop_codon:yes gene_type:complete
MIFDAQSLFSDAQAITADAASTNVLDLGAAGTPKHAKAAITQDVGRGRDVPIRIQVVEDFNTLTSLDIAIEVDNDEAFGSATVVSTVTVLLADLVAGYVAPTVYLPRGVNERYVRLNYNVNGTNPTTGKITAGLVFGNEAWSA